MMPQLLCHLWGDYILQSHWMAQNKTKSTWACLFHVVFYSLPFLLLKPSWTAFAVIFATHFVIDRFGLAKYLVWWKNYSLSDVGGLHTEIVAYDAKHHALEERRAEAQAMLDAHEALQWKNCKDTGGYPKDTPPFLWVWLTIAADNTLHLTINWLALTYL